MTLPDTFPAHHSVEFAAQAAMEGMTVIGNLVDSRQIVKIPKPDGTDLTNGDIAVDDRIHQIYAPFGDVIIRSEERQPFPVPRPESPRPILYNDQDPNDGTTHFWERYKALKPDQTLTAGAMVSMGGIYEGDKQPRWGVVGAQFLVDGPVVYTAQENGEAWRHNINRDDRQKLSRTVDRVGKEVILLASKNSFEKFGPQLEDAGFDVLLSKTSVANMLSVCDPTLFEQYNPDILRGRKIGGAIMSNCHDWDIAGVIPIIRATGRIVTGKTGKIRAIGQNESGGVVSNNRQTHEILIDVMRRAA